MIYDVVPESGQKLYQIATNNVTTMSTIQPKWRFSTTLRKHCDMIVEQYLTANTALGAQEFDYPLSNARSG